MTKNDIIHKLKEVKPFLAEKYGLTSLALFGSYSRNEQNNNSDIDLLIDFSNTSADYFFECAFALQDVFKNSKVEIVTKEGIKSKYFEAIKQDLIYA